MLQEEIYLLLKDLCARLLYGVICQVDDGAAGLNDGKLVEIDISKELARFDADYYWDAYIDDVKPYLRPLSSITEEEKKELSERYVWKINGNEIKIKYHSDGYWDNDIYCPTEEYLWLFDWLNAHHFDYHGLIEKGLALEAPEGMYNLKNK